MATRESRNSKVAELRQLGERIREQRSTAKLTQQQLAQRLGVSVAYVSLIERGRRNPPYTTVLTIARALQVAPARFVGRG
jgi:transcriptional regulator with XRE-family HTH domain